MISEAFPRGARLLASRQYQAVFQEGRRLTSPHLRLFVHVPAGASEPRLGVAVSKKVDKRAVGRNRLKRLARELFRRERASLPPGDYVLIAQPGAKSQSLPQLRAQFEQLLGRARALKPLAPAGTMPASAAAPEASPTTPDRDA